MAVKLLPGDWISASELKEVARSLEPWCTESTPRWLRRRGLLPAPVRIGGQYWYPVWAGALLRADTRWRQRSVRDVEARRLLLWVQGFPLSPADVRRILVQFVDDWISSSQLLMSSFSGAGALANGDVSAVAIRGLPSDVATSEPVDMANVMVTIEAAAAELISKRSRSPLPEPMRKRRMSRHEKQEAVIFALLSLLHLVEAAAERTEGPAALDRMIGLDRRRKSVQPYLTSEDPLAIARAADPERMRRGAAAADDEIELARRYIRLAIELGPADFVLMAKELGPAAEEMLEMMRATAGAVIGPAVAFGLTSLAGAFHDHRAELDVEEVLRELNLSTVAWELHELLEKEGEKLTFREALSPAVRRRVEKHRHSAGA